MNKFNRKKMLIGISFAILIAGLITSIVFNVLFTLIPYNSYLQNMDEIYIMEAGILRNSLEFVDGEELTLSYDFDNQNYNVLVQKYKLDNIAGNGSEFDKALRLMNEFAPRLTHKSDYDNHIPLNALDLLDYSLNNKKQGINCRAKAQILNEMNLSLGIYSRKVWIIPNSRYDNDCHVVNEIWDTQRNKWIMLDITNNEYWVDENGTPLSILEIRTKGAMREFCTPVKPSDKLNNLQKLQNKHFDDFLYIMKNMTYMEYCADYGIGESNNLYLLFPKNLTTNYENIISENSVINAPYESKRQN